MYKIESALKMVQDKFPQQAEEASQLLKLYSSGQPTLEATEYLSKILEGWAASSEPMTDKELLTSANTLLSL